jgi:hypothetical protein
MPASLNPLAAHVAQPAGAEADENGIEASPDVGSTATECALLPVGSCATTVCVIASMIASTGVHGDAALHAPLTAAFPLAVQRLAAL